MPRLAEPAQDRGVVRVLDVSHRFAPAAVGAALRRLDPRLAVSGEATCPLTRRRPADPVLLADGGVYEKQAVLRWLQDHDCAPPVPGALPGGVDGAGGAPLAHRTVLCLAPLQEVVSALSALGPAEGAGHPGRLGELEEALEAAELAARPAEVLEALATLERSVAESSEAIREWQSLVDRAREAAERLRGQASYCAAALLRAAAGTHLARRRLLSREPEGDGHAAAQQIQRWFLDRRRRKTQRSMLRRPVSRDSAWAGLQLLQYLWQRCRYGPPGQEFVVPWIFAAYGTGTEGVLEVRARTTTRQQRPAKARP